MEADLGEEVPHDVSPAPEGGLADSVGTLRAPKVSLAAALSDVVSRDRMAVPKGP